MGSGGSRVGYERGIYGWWCRYYRGYDNMCMCDLIIVLGVLRGVVLVYVIFGSWAVLIGCV